MNRTLSALLIAAVAFTAACSSTPPPPSQICMGPETPDDLEDFYDRDIVRHPDALCTAGDPRYAFTLVDGVVPEIGAEIGEEDSLLYRSSQRSRLRVPAAPRSSSPTSPRTVAPTPAPSSASRASVSPSAPRVTPSPAPRATPTPTRAPAATRAPATPRANPAPAPRQRTCTGTGTRRRCS